MNPYETAGLLSDRGIKPSLQRIAIYNFLCNNRIHPTADEVFRGIKDAIPTLSKTTVYNTLSYFLEKDVVQQITIDDSSLRYDINTKEHGHFLCKKCGMVYDFPFPLNDITQHIPSGFSILSYHINTTGICKDCNYNSNP
ncbi:MAG: Fur family transcriptional regulator [Fibrobacterota bacterium]